MESIVKEQILGVRDTCETNMFDTAQVTKIALKMGYYELANYLLDHKGDYTHFIIYGETKAEQDKAPKEREKRGTIMKR